MMRQLFSWAIVGLVGLTAGVSPAAAAKQVVGDGSVPARVRIAQARPSFSCLKLHYTASGILHNAALVMPAGSSVGVMVTEFYDGNVGGRAMVEQTMAAVNSAEGLLIVGSNPVYPGTTRPYRTYSPDNFLLRVTPDGDIAAVNCDDNSVCAQVRVTTCE
jgi:hypothetical protein